MQEKTVLLVEDNPDDADLALRAFTKTGIPNRVEVARNGTEAWDYLNGKGNYAGRDLRDVPRLILLDLNLRKIGGLDVLKMIRADERTKYIPVVILTSSKEEQDVIRGYKWGASSYLRKPVDFDRFCEAVKQLGLYWLALNEPFPAKRGD